MTSELASNAIQTELSGFRHTLEANSIGEPIQKQIRRSETVTTTNTAAVLTGANIPITDNWILSDTPVANQTYTMTAGQFNNMLNRRTVIAKTTASANTTTIVLPAGKFFFFAGATGAQTSATFPTTRLSTAFVWTSVGVVIEGSITGWTFA